LQYCNHPITLAVGLTNSDNQIPITMHQRAILMEELQAKWIFDQGGFAKAVIAPTPMGQGYHLHLVKFGRQHESVVLERQRGGWRVFKTIDAAANTANSIGFKRIEVDLSSR
jgi:hypothetical protein